MSGKAVGLGIVGGVLGIALCAGVVYYHTQTSGDFVARADATGNQMIVTVQTALSFFDTVCNFFKTLWNDVVCFFTGRFGEMQLWGLIGQFFQSLWDGLSHLFDGASYAESGKFTFSGLDDFWIWFSTVFNPVNWFH